VKMRKCICECVRSIWSAKTNDHSGNSQERLALSVWQRRKIPLKFSFAIQPAPVIGRNFFSIYTRNS
jgi:hypothetical protein